MRGVRIIAAAASVLSLVATAGCSGPGDQPSATGAPAPTTVATSTAVVTSARDFDPQAFAETPVVDNLYFPLVPGTRYTWEGHAFDEGERLERRVVFTVSDVVKQIGGVNAVVGLDLDYNDGERAEQEIMFFAQDGGGNVWLMGEYPEEYEGDTIVKTPAWIHGSAGARAGLTMKAAPSPDDADYAQGWGPKIGWNDRAGVFATDEQTCTPVDCYDAVLILREFSQDQPGAAQLKYYAPGVGTVRVGWKGPNEEEQEEMVLVGLERLTPEELDEVRAIVLAQEARAYERSDVYRDTVPMSSTAA
jgi:hypothetical protein